MTMFDRDRELGVLKDLYGSVNDHGGKIALVCGEAGIGKSTFVNQFLSQLDKNVHSAIALCDPLFTPRPLGPIRDLLASLQIVDISDADEVKFYFEDFVNRLRDSKSTLVLVIEDLHWVDQRTLDWLQFVGRRITQLPLLLIGTYRDDEVTVTHPLRAALATIAASSQVQLPLMPLSLTSITRMSENSPIEANHLLSITGGNPFFLTELLRTTIDSGEVPSSISDAINSRLNNLPEQLQAFIEFLSSVLGTIPYNLLQSLTGDDSLPLVDDAIALNVLLASPSGVTFRHELVRLTAFNRVQPLKRRDYQTKILTALLSLTDKTSHLDRIVHYAAEIQSAQILLKYAPQAATKAAHYGAHREAASYLAKAISVLGSAKPNQAALILEDWAYEAGLSLNIDTKVIDARLRAIDLWRQIGRNDKVGENLRWLSRLHWYRGESVQAQAYIEEALNILEQEPPSIAKAQAYALRGQYCMLQDHMDEAISWAQKALPLAIQFDDIEIRTHALNTIGTAKMFRADLTGEQELRLSLDLALSNNLDEQAARVYTNLSECLIESRQLAKAETVIEQGIVFDSAHDLDAWTFYLVGRKAQLRFEQNHYEEARLIAENVLAREDQTLLMKIPAAIVLARALVRLGDSKADKFQKQAIDDAEKINEPQYFVAIQITELELAVLKSQSARANAAVKKLLALKPEFLSNRKRGECCFWAILAGLELPMSYSLGLPLPFAEFLAGNLEQAATLFLEENSDYYAAWCLLVLGGADFTQQAASRFNELNAHAALETIQQPQDQLANINWPVSTNQKQLRSAQPQPYSLTKKERLVLSLLVEGNSNAAIATELSRSRRTIENHVANIFAKLGCNNRVDALLKTQSEPWIIEPGSLPE